MEGADGKRSASGILAFVVLFQGSFLVPREVLKAWSVLRMQSLEEIKRHAELGDR
jgi:hypothetical protein